MADTDKSPGYVHLEVDEVMAFTEKAMLLRLKDGHGVFWFPKSQIINPEEYQVGDRGTVTVTDFIAREKGLA